MVHSALRLTALLAAACNAEPIVEAIPVSPSAIAEQLKQAPPEKVAAVDKELGSEKHMVLADFYHFYFTDEMMAQFDYSHDMELVSRMFNDCDVDHSADIDWKEYVSLDALLREEFEPAFYARQHKQAADAQKKHEEILASRQAKKSLDAAPKAVAKKVEAPAAESKGQHNSALAAAIAAQAQRAAAEATNVI